jgi:hypothetical protein
MNVKWDVATLKQPRTCSVRTWRTCWRETVPLSYMSFDLRLSRNLSTSNFGLPWIATSSSRINFASSRSTNADFLSKLLLEKTGTSTVLDQGFPTSTTQIYIAQTITILYKNMYFSFQIAFQFILLSNVLINKQGLLNWRNKGRLRTKSFVFL